MNLLTDNNLQGPVRSPETWLHGGDELNARRVFITSIILLGHMLYAGQCVADSWQQYFSSRASTEFETNPSMSQASTAGVWRALVEPDILLVGDLGTSQIKTGLDLQLIRSSNTDLSPNRINPDAFFNWVRPSEVGEFGITSKYTEEATRNSGIDAVGQVPVNSVRDSRYVAGNWTRQISMLNTFAADVSYEDVTYNAGSLGTGSFVNYSLQSAGMKFTHAHEEQLSSYYTLASNTYTPDTSSPSSTLVDAALGLLKKTENSNWTLQIGGAKVTGNDTSMTGMIGDQYTGLTTKFSFNAGRVVAPSGFGGFVKSDRIMGSLSYTLGEYDTTGIDLDSQKALSTTGLAPLGAYFNSTAWVDHEIAPFWKARMYLGHRYNSADTGFAATSNLVGITFTYAGTADTSSTSPFGTNGLTGSTGLTGPSGTFSF